MLTSRRLNQQLEPLLSQRREQLEHPVGPLCRHLRRERDAPSTYALGERDA
jgi:hypothetical protein